MRIIAGTLKGRRLEPPDWPGLRPTSDKLRETLFNVLGPRVVDARVLDGFAGTGAVGIEALSRGAAHVTFVEADGRATRLIERNLQHCRITDRYTIIRVRFTAAARQLAGGTFDIVWLDPPYAADDPAGTLGAAASLVRSDGLVILEHARRDPAPAGTAPLAKVRDIVSGDSALTLYQPAAPHDPAAGAI